MSAEDRRIYKVTGGTAAAIIAEAEAARKAQHARCFEFAGKHGGNPITWHGQGGIAGLEFGGEPPAAWRKSKRFSHFVPRANTKEGKAIDKEMRDINAMFDVEKHTARLFTGDTWVFSATHLIRPTYGYAGEQLVVAIHKDSKAVPVDGLEEIPLSEFYRLQGK